MPARLKSFLRNGFSILLAAVFLYFAFRGTSFKELWSSLAGANYWWLLALVPVTVISHWLRAVRWAYLLKPIKADISRRNLFSGVMIGYAVNNLLPRVGELVRPVVLGKLENVSRSAALGTVVIERILDIASFYLITCVVLFIYPHSLDPFVSDAATFRPILLIGSVGALAIFLLLFLKAEALVRLLSGLQRFVPERYRSRVSAIADSFATGLNVAHLRDHFGAVAGFSLLIWGFYALGMLIPFYSFDVLVARGLNMGDAVLLLVISSIAWILPAPGAMGTYHSFVTVTLVRLYGIDTTTALSYSIVSHEVGYIVAMALGAWFYVADRKKVAGLSLSSVDGKDA